MFSLAVFEANMCFSVWCHIPVISYMVQLCHCLCFPLLKWLSFSVFEDKDVVRCVVGGMCGAGLRQEAAARPLALLWVSLQPCAHLAPPTASTASNRDSCSKLARVLHVLWPREGLRVVCGLRVFA